MSSIKQDLFKGVFWSAIEKYSGIIVSIIVSMILARLLSPVEYGIIATATVIIAFLQIFCTMGLGPAVIQRRDLSNKDINILFSFSLIIGSLLSVLFFLSSRIIALFYNELQLVTVCRVLSIQVFFASANIVPNALMNKNKRFKDIAKRTLTLQIISGFVSIVSAFYGVGVYALLFPPVFTSIGIFLWNRKFYKLQIVRLNIIPIKKIYSFSVYQFAFEFFNFFSRNLDKLIIGKYMSSIALGYYEKSYRLMQMPLQNVTFVINPVMLPLMSTFQDDLGQIAKKYNKVISFVALISFPISMILYMCGSEIIFMLYGNKWEAAIPVFKILALSIPTQMILSTSGTIWQAINSTNYMFWTGIVNTCITVMGFIFAICCSGTIESIAWAWTITSIVNFLNTYLNMYLIKLKSSFYKMIKELFIPFIIAVVIYFVLFFINSQCYIFHPLIMLVTKLFFSIIITLVIVQISGRLNLKDIFSRIFNKNV